MAFSIRLLLRCSNQCCRWLVDQTMSDETNIGRAINQDLRRAGEYTTILHRVRIDKETRLLALSVRLEAVAGAGARESALARGMGERISGAPEWAARRSGRSTSQALHYLTGRTAPVVKARTPRVRPWYP